MAPKETKISSNSIIILNNPFIPVLYLWKRKCWVKLLTSMVFWLRGGEFILCAESLASPKWCPKYLCYFHEKKYFYIFSQKKTFKKFLPAICGSPKEGSGFATIEKDIKYGMSIKKIVLQFHEIFVCLPKNNNLVFNFTKNCLLCFHKASMEIQSLFFKDS